MLKFQFVFCSLNLCFCSLSHKLMRKSKFSPKQELGIVANGMADSLVLEDQLFYTSQQMYPSNKSKEGLSEGITDYYKCNGIL